MFGIALVAVSVYSYISTQRFLSAAVRATGVVSQVQKTSDTFYPRISFLDKEGHIHVFDSKLRSKPPTFSVGDRVTVLYTLGSPTDARIERFFELWFFTIVTGVIGLALNVAGVMVWVFRRHLFQQYEASPTWQSSGTAQKRARPSTLR
jgi:hypothetical protein